MGSTTFDKQSYAKEIKRASVPRPEGAADAQWRETRRRRASHFVFFQWFARAIMLARPFGEHAMKQLTFAAFALLGVASFAPIVHAIPFSDPRADKIAGIDASAANEVRDPACSATTLVSAGGPFPKNRHTLAVRWTGFSNYELVYDGHILLLDAYYDRGAAYPPLGVKAADIKKADVLILGHGHFDHMSDAASIGARTKATVVGAPVTSEKLATQPIPAAQVKTVTGKGGELLKFNGFTVEPILGRHGEPERQVAETIGTAIDSLLPSLTPEQKAEEAAIRSRGTGGPRVITEGTIAYLITLDDGFKIMYRDSAGVVTDYEKAAMVRIGRVDLAITALRADYLPALTAKQALEYLRVYKPDVIMPAHHDGALFAGHDGMWRSTEPVFQAMKDENPALITVSRGYREPTCFNTEFNLSRAK
jgi:L-ascorbate metabolism protein UlaG (beta-lactamase superfamily)